MTNKLIVLFCTQTSLF